MIGWHHWLNWHEFEKTLGDGEGQGSSACCSPWGHKESDTTQRLNSNNEKTKCRLEIQNSQVWMSFSITLVIFWLVCVLSFGLKDTLRTKIHIVYAVPLFPSPYPQPCQFVNKSEKKKKKSPVGWKPVHGLRQLERIAFHQDLDPIYNGNPDGQCCNYSLAVMNVSLWSVVDFSMVFFHGRFPPWEMLT